MKSLSMMRNMCVASAWVALFLLPFSALAEEAGIGDWGVNDATYGLKTREAEPGFTYTPSPADWRDVNVYQVFTDRFADSGEDQLGSYKPAWKTEGKSFPQNRNFHHGGDWKGMKNNIAYLTGMGVKAVWMSGVQMNDQGKDANYTPYHQYHPENFFKCDPAMGTFQDLRELIDALHAAGIYVILDVAPNHMCDKNGLWGNNQQDDKQYFANGNSTFGWWDQNNKHPAPFDNLNYFHNNGTINCWDCSPENLLGQFKGTDDLKTEDAAVQSILSKAFKNLIDATDCDGFRVDAIKHMEYNWNKQWADDMRKHAAYRGKNDFILFGELFSYDNAALASWCKDAGYSYNSALFFPLSQTIKSVFVDNGWAGQLTQQLNNKSQYGEGADRLVAFIDNHDLNRIALMSGGDTGNDVWKLRPALSFLYLATPVPCLYYGTEHAFDQGGHYNGSSRTEDNPDDGDWQRECMFDKGFQPGPAQGNKLAATDAPLYQHVAALNAARAAYKSLTRGSFQERYADGAYAFSRVYDEEEALVAINLQDGNKNFDAQVSKPDGTEFVNVLNPTDVLTVGGGKLAIGLSGKETKVYVAGVAAPTLWARGTHSYPVPGEVTSDTAIYINAEAGPAGSVTNVELGYSLDGGSTWETPIAMALNAEWSSQGGAWYNATLGTLPAGTAVQYFVAAHGDGDSAYDNNNGQNYAFTVAQGASNGLWIRGTKNYPLDGAATFATELYVDAEVGPAGGVSNVSVVVSADGAPWATNAMTLNPDWGSSGGNWYNANLGTFAEGAVVRYFIEATDGEETIVADNGGLYFQVTIRGAGLAITNPPGNLAVANETATYALQGTASAVTNGNLRWTNALTGAAGQFAAASPWTLADVALGVGANVITVSGETGGGGGGAVAADSGSNYGGGWTDGSNQGSGFGPWSFNHTQDGTTSWAGVFIGNPTNAGIAGFGETAFGFYANPPASGANAEVQRSFSAAMAPGAVFSFKLGLNWDSNAEGSCRGFSLLAGDTELVYINMANSAAISINGAPMFNNYGAQAMALHFEYAASGSIRVWGTGRDGAEPYDQTLAVGTGAPTRFKFYFNATDAGTDERQMYVDDLEIVSGAGGETLSAMVTITRNDVPVDTNGDGVPDAWLADHGRDPSTPGSDLAPNGYTYWESYTMDLDPDDTSLPPIQMESGVASPFTFGAPTNRRYMVQFTSNLFLPFQDVGEGVDVGAEIALAGEPSGFYRVRFYDETGENETVTVSAVPGSTTFTNPAGLTVMLNVSGINVVTSTYAVAGGAPAGFTNGQQVVIGAGWTNNQTGLLTLYGATRRGVVANRAYGYTYTDAAQLELTSVGGTHHWVSDENQVFINSAGQPEGSTVSAHIIYCINGPCAGDWPLIPMDRIPDWENGDWWHEDLGILNDGDVVQFAIVMADAFGNEIWDNNGGANYVVTIGDVEPPPQGGEKPYSTNPSFGKRETMAIDGSPSGWTTNHLIAIDMANDDPRSLGGNWTMHEPPIDATHLWAAWDDDNLYLAWQFVDVTDVIDPANAGGAGSGRIGSNDGILQWLVLDTIAGQGATADVWGKLNSWVGPNKPNYQIYLAGSLWQGYISRAVDGVFALDDGGVNYNTIAAAGIVAAKGNTFGAGSLWGVDDCDNRNDAGAPTRDFLTQGHSASRDSFYEMSIPLSYLGITAAQLDTGAGIGIMVGAGSTSSMDSLPHDETTVDLPGVESYNSSFEWGDSDNFTAPFARIGR
jgi:glycosidase